jgi:beta-N-acetylhexosaminidase
MIQLERLASACILPGFPGETTPDWVRRELERGLGGVVLFAWNVRAPEQVSELTASLRAERDDVLVGIDEEGGDVTRLEADAGSSYPGNYALGTVDDPDLTRRVAAAMGRDVASVGVNLDLAPVADVLSNPESPIVGVRSFGTDPALVARHVHAFVKGLQGSGVAACAKHFPGHGATAEDSHLELPTVTVSRKKLSARELVPFRAAIEADVAAILTAHIRVPAVDTAPATLSPAHLEGMLRHELGFAGLVVTDALEMSAISRSVGVEEGAVLALAAGADALCLGHDLGADAVASVRASIVAAVEGGRVAEERLVEAAGRVNATARAFPGRGTTDGTERLVGLEAARRAVRTEGAVALRGAPLVAELASEPSIAAGPTACSLGKLLVERIPGTRVVAVESPDMTERISTPAGGALVLVLRDAHRHPWQREVATELVAREPTAVVVEVGLPLWKPKGARGYVATHGAGRASLTAAAELLTA